MLAGFKPGSCCKTGGLPSERPHVLCKVRGYHEKKLFKTQAHSATACAFMLF